FSEPDEGILGRAARVAGAAGVAEQFSAADRLAAGGDAHPVVFRDLVAGGAGGRRAGGNLDGMDDAELEAGRGGKRGGAASGEAGGHPATGVLSAHAAADGGPRIHCRGYHAGGQLTAPCGRELSRADLRGDRVVADRGERVDVLWI